MLRNILGSAAVMAMGLAPLSVALWHDSPQALSPLATALPTEAQGDSQTPRTLDTAVLAGGCFWGVEAVFEHTRGVTDVVSGYAGGDERTAVYDVVSTGKTKHAESVRIIYDPSQISYANLLRIFFSIAHDPTQLNRQGPDVGPQYRSVIFYTSKEQERIARAYMMQVADAKVFKKPIVTVVQSLSAFYPAESYHQDFMARHPDHPYIVQHDRPKVEAFEKKLPELFREGGKTGKLQ